MDKVYINTNEFSGWFKEKFFDDKDFYSIEEILDMLQDLDEELEATKEQFEDYKQYVKSNYKEMNQAELIDYSRDW